MSGRTKQTGRQVRHSRLRKRIAGSPEKPRLSVFRSLRHISAQLIDDSSGVTIASASSLEKAIDKGGNKNGAEAVGSLIAQRAKDKGINQVIFDRGGFRYAGRVAALAEAARKGGLQF